MKRKANINFIQVHFVPGEVVTSGLLLLKNQFFFTGALNFTKRYKTFEMITIIVGSHNHIKNIDKKNGAISYALSHAWQLMQEVGRDNFQFFNLSKPIPNLDSLEQAILDCKKVVVFDDDFSSPEMTSLLQERLSTGILETILFSHGTVTTYVTKRYKNATRCEEVFVLAPRLLVAV